ncbi:transcriptional regulator TrmB [Natronococcus amylolyticus DSM 10524]|uniref:Transcriptional regulator TrmB n=1 Tax=Natronococcus amylolyticus DSM 10524 TaxID=1227497 RepID=L9WVQ2_9EURY|nr:TrmB family transcriptional regulator [Natronococcus amylolyticus]ELY53515.1 transcriptional regulator TrmB [Natronococcus amylolyticus DSM 10524]
MNPDELVATLEEAGLSPYQADAFVTLLERGSASATDVAQASSVPDPRIYDVLRGLEERGYVETYEQESLQARARDPTEVLEDLRSRATRLESAADEIETRWTRPDIEDHAVSIVKRFDTVLARANELVRSADHQVQIGLTPAQFDALEGALETARENGADVKVCLFPETAEESSLPSAERLARTCTEARHRRIPAPFVALVDRSWTCFAPNRHSANEYGVLVNDRTHTYVFYWYFSTCLWDVYEPVYSARDDRPPTTYVDIRECLRRIEPLLEDDRRVEATVEGFETDTGREITVSGTITDIAYSGTSGDDGGSVPITQFAGKAGFTLESGTESYTVGGWGAIIEDVEAVRIGIDPSA